MMETIRQFAAMVCVAAVGCCALRLLLPQSALEPVLRVILSAFFLLCLLLPLRGISLPEFSAGSALFEGEVAGGQQQLSERLREQVEQAAGDNLRTVIDEKLKKFGISGTNIGIKIHTSTAGSIDITGVELMLPQEYAHLSEKARAYVEDELELPCQIGLIGEDNEDGT
ncbi:MAG: hypothetical protein DBX66_00410 [Clostridiales bacterium]|nr:MAG: hypothetical protein DBX66_00410 [Clostridiales bacterium]RGB66481.1 hypothetical protein DW086_08385 [Harryflintia acetispora]